MRWHHRDCTNVPAPLRRHLLAGNTKFQKLESKKSESYVRYPWNLIGHNYKKVQINLKLPDSVIIDESFRTWFKWRTSNLLVDRCLSSFIYKNIYSSCTTTHRQGKFSPPLHPIPIKVWKAHAKYSYLRVKWALQTAPEPESNILRRPQTKTHLLKGESSQPVRSVEEQGVLWYHSNINSYRACSDTTRKAVEEQQQQCMFHCVLLPWSSWGLI